jgi:hypothetical protein
MSRSSQPTKNVPDMPSNLTVYNKGTGETATMTSQLIKELYGQAAAPTSGEIAFTHHAKCVARMLKYTEALLKADTANIKPAAPLT